MNHQASNKVEKADKGADMRTDYAAKCNIKPKQLYLFVPATRLDRVAKAAQSDADIVVIDLEDAIAGNDKDSVRADLLSFDKQYYQQNGENTYYLRVNRDGSKELAADVALIGQLGGVRGLLLPKCETADSVTRLATQTGLPVIAMIETAVGIANIAQIAHAKGLATMSFGRLDLLKDLGVREGSVAAGVIFDRIRTDLLVHTRAAGRDAPIETIFTDFNDVDALSKCVHHWADFGFGGQLVIHPKQIATIRGALSINARDLIVARKIYERYLDTGEAVFSVDGRMVDLPLIAWAADVLGEPMPDLY